MYCRLKTNKFPSLFLSLHALRTFSEFIEFSRKVISTHIISQTHTKKTQRNRHNFAISNTRLYACYDIREKKHAVNIYSLCPFYCRL